MIPKGLVIGVAVGVIAGAIFGLIFADFKNLNQLEFVKGSSLSIVTEKLDFDKGEEISIRIINSGTISLTFSDTSYGLKITGLDGRLLYAPVSAQMITTLKPNEEVTFVWNQIKNDGDQILEGVYKISSNAFDENDNAVKKSITINILK